MKLTVPQLLHSFALNRCRASKIISPARLINHFGVETLIRSVAADPSRLADIVVRVTGTHRKIVEKLSVEKSIESVNLALDVEAATPDDLFDEMSTPAGISTDEIAFFFPGDQVFELWFNAGWVAGDADDKVFMANLWEFIIEHRMFGPNTYLDLVTELGLPHFMSDKIPHASRTALLEAALQRGEPLLRPSSPGSDNSSLTAGQGSPFTAKHLLTILPPSKLVQHVLLSELARPLMALAKLNGWIKLIEVPLPQPMLSEVPPAIEGDPTGLPPGVADSVIPPANAAEDAEAEALAASENDPDSEIIIDQSEDEDKTRVGPPPGKKDKKGPPPLRGR